MSNSWGPQSGSMLQEPFDIASAIARYGRGLWRAPDAMPQSLPPEGPLALPGATPPSPVGSPNVANAAPGASGGTGAQPPGPLAASAAPTPAPAQTPPGMTLTTLPQHPSTPTPPTAYAQPSAAAAPTPPARPYTHTPGAVQGQPSPGYGQTSQNASPTDPNSPRGTNQQPGYYTPTTGIGRGPGTWHPGSIADAIHNAGVGVGQHLDQTFGVTRPPGYYDYRGQGQPTYNGPLSQPVVNNMGGSAGPGYQAAANPLPQPKAPEDYGYITDRMFQGS